MAKKPKVDVTSKVDVTPKVDLTPLEFIPEFMHKFVANVENVVGAAIVVFVALRNNWE